MKKVRASFIPAIGWLALSIVLLTLPGSSFPKENWFDKIWLDKWIHIGLFAVLVILWCLAVSKKYSDAKKFKKLFLWTGLIGLAYGTGMEFVQKYFIANRSFDAGDIIADGMGCALGVIYSIRIFAKNRPL